MNLENLIPTRPKSTNPFGSSQAAFSTTAAGTQQLGTSMSSSNSSGQLNNPFLTQQLLMNQKNPTISQLQNQQQMQQQQSMFPSFPATNQIPFNNTGFNGINAQTNGFGQLAQPLLPPSNSQSNLVPLSFGQQSSIMSPTPPPMQSNYNAFNQNNQATSNQTTNPFLMM